MVSINCTLRSHTSSALSEVQNWLDQSTVEETLSVSLVKAWDASRPLIKLCSNSIVCKPSLGPGLSHAGIWSCPTWIVISTTVRNVVLALQEQRLETVLLCGEVIPARSKHYEGSLFPTIDFNVVAIFSVLNVTACLSLLLEWFLYPLSLCI